MLENGADLDGKLRAAFATLLQAVPHDTFWVLLARLGADASQIVHATADHAAMRARHPSRPDDAFEIRESLGFVVEVRGRKNRHGKRSECEELMPYQDGFVNYLVA